MNSVTVRVPATSANFACGFDVLGCAWTLYDTLRYTRSDTLCFSGCGAALQNEDNLAWRAFEAVYRGLGQTPPKVRIDIRAEIPLSRGLGSSAAVLAAGAMAANALSGAGLSKAALLELVTPIEGHPDNLAPAFFGGLVASMRDGERVRCAPWSLHPSLRFTALYPDYTLPTAVSRAALPKQVPFSDAVFELSRLALLPTAFRDGDLELLALCLDDRLHQPFRRPLIDGMDEVRKAAEALGCRAFCISGAGPSLLCITDDAGFSSRLSAAVEELPHAWTVLPLSPDGTGAVQME